MTLKKRTKKIDPKKRVKASISNKRVLKSEPKKRAVLKIAHKKRCLKRSVKKFCSCKTKKCGCRSAFAAAASTDQPITPIEITQVQYSLEEFDTNREYNPATSIFRPKKSGVYTLFASATFVADENVTNFFGLFIRVNGRTRITDTETSPIGSGSIDASGIVRLNAGDDVQVFFATLIAGSLVAGIETRFEGARVG
ncbi:hypothetical protein SAMN05216378_1197 [Paenibacillus catalpae]|uniref:C1q domain-containing protein n=1 Tax=Paenibacillus catalpae TaxID=1045775 RepID=A0A1I1UZQ1_9BACL|nr:hypothetical protein [Paenibacillus catalpae]SFD73520.1 hypothetical protein SAMN05216378_1197 [Paenibacillus catalpae]